MIKIIICSSQYEYVVNCHVSTIFIFVLSSIVEVHYTKYVDALELDDGDRTSQWKRATQR